MDKIKFSYKIKAIPDVDQQTITLLEEYSGMVTTKIMSIKEECIKDALITMGWTPPREKINE